MVNMATRGFEGFVEPTPASFYHWHLIDCWSLAGTRLDKKDLLGVLGVLSEAGGSIKDQRSENGKGWT